MEGVLVYGLYVFAALSVIATLHGGTTGVVWAIGVLRRSAWWIWARAWRRSDPELPDYIRPPPPAPAFRILTHAERKARRQRIRAIVDTIREDEIVVDALLGTGFGGEVRSPTAELIDALGQAPRRAIVAIDVPSGLDCDTGAPSNATIRADLTITFVAAKSGFSAESAAPYVGRVAVVDIGAPPEAVAEVLAEGP